MSTAVKKTMAIISFCFAFLLFDLFIYISFHSHVMGIRNRFLISGAILFFLLLSQHLSCEHLRAKQQIRYRHMLCIFLFLFYVGQLIYMLFFAPEFSRDYVVFSHSDYLASLMTQWDTTTNLIPFATIRSMLLIFQLPYYDNRIAIINLFGNLIAFMPFAFFLPALCKKTRHFTTFAKCMAWIILGVELIQFFTLTGSMDIDDFILNFAGVMIAYSFLQIPGIQKLFHNEYKK